MGTDPCIKCDAPPTEQAQIKTELQAFGNKKPRTKPGLIEVFEDGV